MDPANPYGPRYGRQDLYGLSQYAAPGTEPVTSTEAKAHCRIDSSADDTMITSLIQAAREYVERFCGRRLITQTWDLKLDMWPDVIQVPYPPLISVSSITYVDSAGTTQTLATTEYTVDATREPGRIYPAFGKVWPVLQDIPVAVSVRFVAGYANAAAVPQGIKQAMLLLIEHWYELREPIMMKEVRDAPLSVENLLWQYRVLEV